MPKLLAKNASQDASETLAWVVTRIIERVAPEKVVLFGSRARGDHSERSDFDIAIYGPKEDGWAELSLEIAENAPTLLKIDLVHFEKVSERLQSRINQEAKILYERVISKTK